MRINEEDKIKRSQKQKYDEQFLRDYANSVKILPNPKITKEGEITLEKYIEDFATKQNAQYTFHSGEDHQKSQLDMRTLVALKILSKIIAKAEFSSTVEKKHIDLAIDLYENTMIKFRQIYHMEMPDNIEEEMIEKNKKVYPRTTQQKIEFILNLIPKDEPMEWTEVLSNAVEYGISEPELERLLKPLIKEGEIGEPRNGFLMRY
jgi:DNA replicative helicase MCM subunit Mcm2 (Cdc46/Mcm family)